MLRVTLFALLISTIGCAQVEENKEVTNITEEKTPGTKTSKAPHKFGGWYCPDNLNGFPAVDIGDWANVPVIKGKLPTQDEAHSEASLIYIDPKEYPDAKAMDIELPKLAEFDNRHSGKTETIIVIQAVEVQGDTIVGFRYLNGGNGSAHYSEVRFMEDRAISAIPASYFVTHTIKIDNTQKEIWEVITNLKHLPALEKTFATNTPINPLWRGKTNANFYYASADDLTGAYADLLFGCYYIQNDYLIAGNDYVEKFLLLENQDENYTELKITCGPYINDFATQKEVITDWAAKIKELSEKK